MSKASNRRCYFFDSKGDPVDGGCLRRASICNYYHPEEEGWKSARIPNLRVPKKHQSTRRRSPTPPSSHHAYRRDSGYQKSRRRSRSRSRSRSSARRARHDSISSSLPDEAPTSRSTSKALAPSSRPDPPPRSRAHQTRKDSTASSLADETGSPRTITTTISSTMIPTSPRTSRHVLPLRPSISTRIAPLAAPPPPTNPLPISLPPPPPKDPLPMPPPQPLPAVPPALSAGVAPSTTVELTVEQKRAMWEERTRILSDAELAREQLTALEEQQVFALQIVESRYFASLPEEDKTRLKGQLAELEKQRNEAKKTQEESLEKLFKTGSWPIAPLTSMEEGVEEKHKEVVTYIQELKDTALQMSKILGDISMFKSPPLFLSGDSDDEDHTAMDIDQPASHKSRKRRRISENLDGPGSGSVPSSMPTQEELDEFLERLAHMEGLISTLQNDINEHSREAREEFEQLVDAKLDEFQTTREEEERKRLEDEQGQIQGLDQELALVGEQVGELATEIGDLIVRMNKLEVDVVESRKGRQQSFEKVLEVEGRLQEYISTREANVHVIQTFEKALNAYTSRPPSPPATPLHAIPPFDYIVQSLEEPMIQAIRSNLVPAIEDLRKDVEDMVRTQNAELYSTLWNKITVTLKVLEMIQSKINLGDIEPQSLAGNITMR